MVVRADDATPRRSPDASACGRWPTRSAADALTGTASRAELSWRAVCSWERWSSGRGERRSALLVAPGVGRDAAEEALVGGVVCSCINNQC